MAGILNTIYNNVKRLTNEVNEMQLVQMPYDKSPIPFYGLESEIPRGWQVCDGTNNTPDLRTQFIRGASNDTEIGQSVGDSTKRPNTNFKTSNNNVGHRHTVNPAAQTVSTTEDAVTTRVFATFPVGTNIKSDQGEALGGTFENGYLYAEGADPDVFEHDGAHTHNVTINIPETTSSWNDAVHSHEVTMGGDSETAPKHIYMYWIIYRGELAPNW